MELVDRILADLTGLPPWLALVAIVLATFVSEDLTCIAAGLLAAGGELSVPLAIVASGLGIFIGDLLLFWAGRRIGRPALRRRPLCWILSDESVERSERWFRERGAVVILLGRFVPGSRLPSYFAAGLLNVSFWSFAAYALVAVVIWSPLLVGAALLLGRGVLQSYEAFSTYAFVALVALALGLLLLLHVVLPLFSWRGRRMLLGRWRRWTHWEFWPPWLFYAPVLVYVLRLAWRHRSLSMLTAVNPGVFAGGFVGESKAEILESLNAPRHTVATLRLDRDRGAGGQLAQLEGFLAERGLAYPIVLKPDQGQRGSGVRVVRGAEEARVYLEQTRVDTLVQEYARGTEYGVFYCRQPDEARGRIISITTKEFPLVVGDGRRTLEELILFDERAVCMAGLYLASNHHRLLEVPPVGHGVQLVEIGNHCRGAIFRDGGHLLTEQMELAFDAISKEFPGFYFGRYDVRVESQEEFRAGRGFKIIELNGATSEATHIYDPSYGLLDAYRVLFEQWRILFRIAAENRARGATSVPWPRLLRSLEEYWLSARSHPS